MRAWSLIIALLTVLVLPVLASAKEPPPIPYRGAPLIPWAKQIGEHRFRSPRNYDDTLKYYQKTISYNKFIKKKKIVNNSEVRAVHYANSHPKRRWEGLNIYEYKGSTIIFVVFTDKELQRIKDEKAGKTKKTTKKPKKTTSKKKRKKKRKSTKK